MQQRYSLVAIGLHWLLALALAFQLSMGLGLESLGLRGFEAFQLHKSVGIAVLLLSLLRLIWRLTHRPPPAAEAGVSAWLAKIVHAGLYLFMIGAPVTGWLLVSTDAVKVPTLLFGTLPWPHLRVPQALNGLAHGSHALFGWFGILLVLLHVAGALRHQWLIRDNLMARMTPGRGGWLVLALLVPIGWVLGIAVIKSVPPAPAREDVPAAAPSEMVTPANQVGPTPPPTSTPSISAPPTWTIRAGGMLIFSVGNGATQIQGRFSRWRGEIVFDPDHTESAEIDMTIDLASASVGDATQDTMLTGPDFLDVAAHPRATFRATSVRQTGTDRYMAQGTLSLKGKSRPQSLTFILTGTGRSRHVEGQAVIDRTAFGIGAGDVVGELATTVSLSFSFDAAVREPK